MQTKETEFSGLRAIFFPINGFELKKFLPMGLMMFFILFNYTIMRDTKDTLVVGAAGAEALSLIKLIGTVPGAIAIMLLYSKLSNIFSRQNLFYVTILPFIIFFGLFAYVIYPYGHMLHPSEATIDGLVADFPRFKTLFYVYGSWSYAVFYVLSELWGSVVLSLLFWQFANEIVRMKEAKRFYSMFGMIANFSLILSGYTVHYFSDIREHVAPGVDPWGVTLNYLMGAIVLSGIITMGIYRWINVKIMTDKRYYDPEEVKGPKKVKSKMSLLDSFKLLIRSKHLGFIALLVICYGISQNVIEGVWKGQIKEVFTSENEYNAFMGRFSMVTGAITICFMLIGTNVVRVFGWLVSALLTPFLILITGMLFFTFVSFKQEVSGWTMAALAMSPTMLAVWLGFGQNVLCKATKYSLFDPTKEMSYIPLDQESKVKGKAAVDVVGARLGKSGGSIVQQFFLFATGGTLISIAPYLAVAVLASVVVWAFAARGLDKSLQSMQNEAELKDAAPQAIQTTATAS